MHRIADKHRHDVADGRHHRDARLAKSPLQRSGALLMGDTDLIVLFEPTDGRRGAGRDRRRQRGGEDEARGIEADGVDQVGIAGDVASHHADGLAQRALDDVYLAHHAVALGHARAPRSIHADRVHFVDVGQGAIGLGQGDRRADVRDVAVH